MCDKKLRSMCGKYSFSYCVACEKCEGRMKKIQHISQTLSEEVFRSHVSCLRKKAIDKKKKSFGAIF